MRFVQSLERHVLRNFIFLHAIENDLPLPIGTQDMGLLDTWANDEDRGPLGRRAIATTTMQLIPRSSSRVYSPKPTSSNEPARSMDITPVSSDRRFKWLRPGLFEDDLANDLAADAASIAESPEAVQGLGS